MYESLAKRLVVYESGALLGLFFGQCLTVVTGPLLIILGFGVWNPFLVLGGLLSLRCFVLACQLQVDVMDYMAAKEQARVRAAPPPRDPRGNG
jgi:hypothetical protein